MFGFEDEAERIASAIEERLALIRERTEDIAAEDRADVVLFATANYVMGVDSIQSHMLTDVVNANNLVGRGTFVPVSEEQLLALDPDVLVVLGHDGYLDPELIFAGANAGLNWANLQDLPAIAEQRVVSLGYEEWRATIETPIGLLKIAAAVYPERFADIDVAAEELRYYQEIYGFGVEAAQEAISLQLWISDEGFVD